MKLIRIIDDFEGGPPTDKDLAERWRDSLAEMLPRNEYRVELPEPRVVQEDISKLEARRAAIRRRDDPQDDATIFDTSDLLIVDYDLVNFDERSMSGEDVAYLARCFSGCGLIVGLNRYKRQGDFNLALTSPVESFADYDVSGKWLADPGLWFADPKAWNLFRPWYWPALTVEMQNFPQRVEDALHHLDHGILNWFQFDGETVTRMPRILSSYLEGENLTYQDVTFRQFVSCSPNALRGKEGDLPDANIARVAAARIHAWLERLVLPRLDILVDAPHLVQDYPSLVAEIANAEAWDRTCHLTSPEGEWNIVGEQLWRPSHWLSRSAWWRDRVSENGRLAEVVNPWGSRRPDLTFCEDTSRFARRSECRRFVAETHSAFAQRYISLGVEEVSYAPAARLAM